MKIFVLTDNRFVYQNALRILRDLEGVKIDSYCSPASAENFADEIRAGQMSVISLKSEFSRLLLYNLGISCHCKQIFPSALVNAVRCINIHPGLNPYNRGWYPQVFAILNKMPVGVTIHEMDEDVDHGPVIVQKLVQANSWDTSLDLYNRILKAEIELFREWAPKLVSGKYTACRPAAEGNYNSRQAYSDLCEINLDQTLTFREAIDYLRAMSHPPFDNAWFAADGKRIFVRLDLKPEDG